jgi:hypothetical protein
LNKKFVIVVNAKWYLKIEFEQQTNGENKMNVQYQTCFGARGAQEVNLPPSGVGKTL